MATSSILLQTLPYTLAGTNYYFGQTHVSSLDMGKILGSGVLYFIFNRINKEADKDKKKAIKTEKTEFSQEKPLLGSKDALFFKNLSRNALAISLGAVDYKPLLKAFSVHICVPKPYQELFAEVFEALINATNNVAIDSLGMKEENINFTTISTKVAINAAGIFIGWGIEYGLKGITESEYIAAFISGFVVKSFNVFLTDKKAIKDGETDWDYLINKSVTGGAAGIVGVAASTYFPTKSCGFVENAVFVTFVDKIQDYAVGLLVESPSFVQRLPDLGKRAFPEVF